MCELPCAHRAVSFLDAVTEVHAADRSKGLQRSGGKG